MKKEIDWLNHALEFAVVLIGILIAFQLNECSDTNSKKELINNHLKYIKLECKENTARLESSIKHIEEALKNCDSLLTEISSKKEANQVRNLSTRLLDLRNVDLVTDSYRVLTESGDIRFLEPYDKKREIITLYNGFDRVESINESTQKIYDRHFYPYLKENFDLANWQYINVKSEEELQKYFAPEFANTISTYRFLLSSKLKICKNEKDMIDQYLSK
ncbi:MAG: DUF6090 family protein [Chitinophagales bacterium]